MNAGRMTKICWPVLCALLLAGCGKDKADYSNYYVNLATVKVDRVVNVSSDPRLKADFEATIACMRQQNPHSVKTTIFPDVVVIDEPTFTCYGYPDTRACTGFMTATIYINKNDLYTYVFTHEAVHWIAQVDDSRHDQSYFQCTYMVDSFYQ